MSYVLSSPLSPPSHPPLLTNLFQNHGPTTSLYYRDPDGNQIETQVDNFETAEEATAFMNSPELRRILSVWILIRRSFANVWKVGRMRG